MQTIIPHQEVDINIYGATNHIETTLAILYGG